MSEVSITFRFEDSDGLDRFLKDIENGKELSSQVDQFKSELRQIWKYRDMESEEASNLIDEVYQLAHKILNNEVDYE